MDGIGFNLATSGPHFSVVPLCCWFFMLLEPIKVLNVILPIHYYKEFPPIQISWYCSTVKYVPGTVTNTAPECPDLTRRTLSNLVCFYKATNPNYTPVNSSDQPYGAGCHSEFELRPALSPKLTTTDSKSKYKLNQGWHHDVSECPTEFSHYCLVSKLKKAWQYCPKRSQKIK